MKLFDTPEEAKKAREKFEEEMNLSLEEDTKEYTSLEINWVEESQTWKRIKAKTKELLFKTGSDRLFFLAHGRDKIEGKPQIIHDTLQRIPLVKKIRKVDKKPKGKEIVSIQYKFIDDPYDKRYDGYEISSLSFDFWVYRVVSNGKENYVFSREKLSEEYSEMEGMQVNLDDLSDMSNSLKIKKITSIFILKNCYPKVNILPKKELIEHVKEYEWNEENFKDYFFSHPDGRIFDYTGDFNKLRMAQILSGKYEGYPLHMLKMGPVGTGKTTEAEVLDDKFGEEQGILEAGNSTLKALVPSFKEKPANLGYICKCNRIAIIDELMKMVEQAMSKTHDNQRVSNYFGQMNMLLEHKKRMVGSGNDNSAIIHSTSKVCVTSNNITGKDTIYDHVGIIDSTTMSRYLVWVQDNEEIEKIYNNEGVKNYTPHKMKKFEKPIKSLKSSKSSCKITEINRTNSPNTPEAFSREFSHTHPLDSWDCQCENKNGICEGISENSDSFLTIYDSCQQFLVNFDEEKCRNLFKTIKNLAKEPMKQVWRARGMHHTILLLDGVTKFRCLFRDYDDSFETKEEDYDMVERLLIHMVKGWDTHMINRQTEVFK